MPILTGQDLTEDRSIECDVCVVGSGVGGAHVAAQLAERGKRVVILEEGSFVTSDRFDMTERNMLPRLYQEAGARATVDQSIQIAQGRAVGGSSVVDFTTCFRTPRRVFDFWQEHHGVRGLSHDALVPHWEAVEKRLNIAKAGLDQVNKNNLVTWNGSKKLGFRVELAARNVKHCARTGYCSMGCPIDAKQSMLVTLIPDAVRAGATLYANARVEYIVKDGRRCARIVAKLRDPESDRPTGVTLVVKAKITVLSGGGINTPALLLRSEVNANGRAGRRTFLHPQVACLGVHAERIEPFTGAPQSVYSDHFGDRGAEKMGFLIEATPLFPMALASSVRSSAAEKQALMEQLPHLSSSSALLHDGFDPRDPDEGATVTLHKDGRPRVDYKWTDRLQDGLREATRTLLRIQLAAGASEALTTHPLRVATLAQVDTAVDRAAFGPNQVSVWSAHVMGGCAMGTDEKTTVVDSNTLRHHGFDDLFVIDGSVFPTSLTVPPLLSLHGLASWASQFVVQAAG